MKKILFGIVIAATTLSACTSNSTQSNETIKTDSTTTDNSTANADANTGSSTEITTHYLHLKNALTNDDAAEAAKGSKALTEAIDKLGVSSLTAEQKTVVGELKDDMKEHSQHISDNGTNIAHQREHFDLLSQEMYDLVKVLKPSQTLYFANCPMYNNNKGANWLSEEKEIKNPYLGKAMLTCGSVKEEIK